ncbi:MAG: type II CAAX endopeptidase family protein [Bacteroides sp.]|nr:type II CAAX endopeptidase family protein [Bacteroides sp.]
MKTSIKLALIYFAMQIFAMLTVLPFAALYTFFVEDSLDEARLSEISMTPMLLVGIIYMLIYLWKKNYLADDGCLYHPTTPALLGGSLLGGLAMIFLVSCLMTQLSFLPDVSKQAFDTIQSGWLGILSIAVFGPVLEELLFRGAITKVLLRKYRPGVAVLFSGLIFGIIHFNPVQVVGASIIGFLLAWVYYRTRSLWPCILIHVLNNSLSTFLTLRYPDVEELPELMSTTAAVICAIVSVVVLLLYLKQLGDYRSGYVEPMPQAVYATDAKEATAAPETTPQTETSNTPKL